MRSWSLWDYGFPESKLRSRLSITPWMLLSCLYLFVVRMLRSRRDSLTLAVIFMSLLAVSQRSVDVWVGPGEPWIHWIMGCGAVDQPVQEDENQSLQVLSVSSLALHI